MSFASVCPHYMAKAETKGRTEEGVHEVIRWLTGYTKAGLEKQIEMQKIRYLDKLIDELAKGKKMEKILRIVQ